MERGRNAELYEIGYLLKPNLKEEEVFSFIEELRNLIAKKGGLVISEGRTKKQPLAYPIKKETAALFNWMHFNLPKGLINEVKKELDTQTKVLRFLLVKKKEEPARIIKFEEAAQVQATEKREEKKQDIKDEELDKKLEELLGN